MDKRQLTDLLQKHHTDAFLWASHCCHYNQEEGKEVLQRAYLKILEKKAVYKEKATFKTWLFSVIRFTAIDYLKKKKSYEPLELVKIGIEDPPYEITTIDYKELLKKLPERQHQVLLLAFYHEMTLAEIATITGLHIGTIRTHYERGKQTMRTLLLKENV
ncbi:sigma-70 family RNA polymerase sigma factor [uncultured Dokdonia sp.]|uniref:RNA polymerase sigma factor n=1 Tax=uncultured Dokdonia sp. TaxID=575653 RepID=UPI002630682D|nr:sigma-70 family RNA polymerase sigma factor [uncultured Dokdonia sp.]